MAGLEGLEFEEGISVGDLYKSINPSLNQGNCLDWQFNSDFFHSMFLLF